MVPDSRICAVVDLLGHGVGSADYVSMAVIIGLWETFGYDRG